jgi:hypothetical protein
VLRLVRPAASCPALGTPLTDAPLAWTRYFLMSGILQLILSFCELEVGHLRLLCGPLCTALVTALTTALAMHMPAAALSRGATACVCCAVNPAGARADTRRVRAQLLVALASLSRNVRRAPSPARPSR